MALNLSSLVPDLPSFTMVMLGALAAGFTTGFAGFGTALVAAGLWFHVLPAAVVPPLVAVTSVVSHIISLIGVRHAFQWRRTAPFLAGGLITVPLGVAALSFATPDLLRLSIGFFLVGYALFQLLGCARAAIGDWGGRWSDGAIGTVGGFLGGFAGLSGAIPVIWLQLRGGPPDQQRATYQPFNLLILSLACFGMAMTGAVSRDVLIIAALCLPVSISGAWLGARAYQQVSAVVFKRVVLALLLTSGTILILQNFLA